MLMLLPLVVHLVTAFPANWNESIACPHDDLYSSLIQDDGEFCSSVLEGNHCGAGYSTPVDTAESRTRGYSDSTEASVGQPGSGTYAETTEGVYSTTEGSWNQTAASGGETTARETTGDTPRTSYTSSSPTTGTASESFARSDSAASWNTTTESPADTQGPFSASFSSHTSSHSQSDNSTQSLTDVTSQASTYSSGMTRSGATSDSLPSSIPGNSTSSPVESGTRLTGTLTGWNSSITAPSGGISGTGPIPTVSVPSMSLTTGSVTTGGSVGPAWNTTSTPTGKSSIPTISLSSGSSVPLPTGSDITNSGSSSSGSVAPSWNTTSASRGNGSVPTVSISSGTFVPFPTASRASSSGTTGPSWNGTTSVSMSNGSVPTISISSGTFVPFPTASVSTSSGGSSSGSVGWNGTTSRGNGSVPTVSISSGTFVPFPTLSLSSQASSESSFGPSWNSTSLPPGANTSVPVTSASSGTLVPFPTSSGGFTSESSVGPSWNSTSLPPGGNTSLPTISASTSAQPSSADITSDSSLGPSWNSTSLPSGGNVSVPTAGTSSGSFVPLPSLSSSVEATTGSSLSPSWNTTSIASGVNTSIPTAITSSGSFSPFPTASLPGSSSSEEAASRSSVSPSWNATSLPPGGNTSVPTVSISSESFIPFPTISLPSQFSSAEATSGSSISPSWNNTALPSGGNVTIPTISISPSQTFVPFPTQPFPSDSLTTGPETSGNQFPNRNSTTVPGVNFTIPSVSISRGGTLPFPTLPLPSESITTESRIETTSVPSSSAIPSWNGTTSAPGGNVSVPTISASHVGTSSLVPFPSASLPTVSQVTSGSARSETLVSVWNTTTWGSEGSGSVATVSSSGAGSIVTLPTESEASTSSQSGDVGWNITSSISGIVSLPTISVPASAIPTLPFPTVSTEVTSTVTSESAVPSRETTGSGPGSTETVTSFSSPAAATSTSGASNGSASPSSNATTTGVPEFPAANFTHVTRTAAISQETCYTLPNPDGDSTRRALLYNSRLREDNVSIPTPYIESVEFEKDGINPLYLTVRDEQGGIYYVDISHRGRLSVVDPNGYLVTLDAEGIHFSGSNCTYDISIAIDDMYEQIADLAGVQCAALKRKRAEDLDFSQVLYLHDQCGNPVGRSVRQYPQLLVGDTVCADVSVDDETGRWDFECTFPGSESGSLRCQSAIKNKVVDFISTDPFGGACPDLSTVVTTLEESGQDIIDPEQLRKDLANQGLTSDRAKQEADAAVIAYTQLWQALGAIFTKNTETSQGALEDYIDVYNTHRSFENDICQSLHEGEIPLNLTLIAGATRIPAITTLNWAPETTKPYNITVQDSSRIACCPNSAVAEGEGATCSYPRDAIIPGTGCVCGKSAAGVGIAFEWTECSNYKGSCEADGDCGDGYLCLTGSCCGGGVCVDAFACSENGTDLVQQFDGGF
ncbi:hypothetical protein CEK26_011370 [Fusarium fujikuroi]|nr:hypothetical protein CEK27_011390 [Fusarium fujikuroi]QGI84645.1 hypothetical protein CEK25_011374 [Fusarium fujikuroi]QGI98301.1 hypothetical protein CEK26_011370 [Fusarium fujikuroi]